MQEWASAILTTEWLLGASMALAGTRLVTWLSTVREEVLSGETDPRDERDAPGQ